MAEPVVSLTNASKSYGTTIVTDVLRSVNLRLEAGEFAALIGPSGSGKSTLLNILGLLDRPTSGSVCINGVETTTLDDASLTSLRGTTLGFVFQFHHLLSGLTAAENVMMPMLAAKGRRTRAMEQRARSLLDRVGLSSLWRSLPSQMSGGQQQRVAIARALAMDPPLVLADEPTGNLDTKTADGVFALLREFNVERHVAFLMVTHDPRLAARCDRTIELVDGRIVSDR
jgi:lipoprotein-releasing system ATP-binding protein